MKILRRIVTLALVAILIPATIETSLRLIAPRPDWRTMIRQRTPEVFDAEQVLRWTDDGAADYASALVNVRSGERVTVGQIANSNRDLYMFGSSTMFGYYNSDAGTLPSQLQRLVPTYRVHNRGAAGDSTPIMLSKLKRTAVQPGDIVIFYDGEIELRHLADDLNSHEFSACRFLLQNANDILLVHALCDNLTTATLDSAIITSAVNQYNRNITMARQYVERHGATFYNVLEPVKYARAESADELALDTYESVTGTMRSAYAPFYAQLPGIHLDGLSRRIERRRRESAVRRGVAHVLERGIIRLCKHKKSFT